MHVHDLNPKKTLATLIIFVVVIIIGFVTLKRPRLTYKENLEKSIQILHDKDACFTPVQLADVLNKVNGNVVLFDIRNNFAFSQGHIPGAENISAYDLTNKENINRLKELNTKGTTVVLYGNNQLEANGPWMVFRQLGFDNVKILLGGYDYYAKHKDNLSKASEVDDSYILERPKYDFAEIAKPSASGNIEQPKVKKKAPVIRRKKKTHAASGGC